jgi:hypothetical protein
VLLNGVLINGERYRFLGHSNSQLKTSSCVLFRCESPSQAAGLLERWGCFGRINSVAKRAKRVGLLFSSITPALRQGGEIRCAALGSWWCEQAQPGSDRSQSKYVRHSLLLLHCASAPMRRRYDGHDAHEPILAAPLILVASSLQSACAANRFAEIGDIEHDGKVFTDGCGYCSLKLAKRIAKQHGLVFRGEPYVPSVLQARPFDLRPACAALPAAWHFGTAGLPALRPVLGSVPCPALTSSCPTHALLMHHMIII